MNTTSEHLLTRTALSNETDGDVLRRDGTKNPIEPAHARRLHDGSEDYVSVSRSGFHPRQFILFCRDRSVESSFRLRPGRFLAPMRAGTFAALELAR